MSTGWGKGNRDLRGEGQPPANTNVNDKKRRAGNATRNDSKKAPNYAEQDSGLQRSGGKGGQFRRQG